MWDGSVQRRKIECLNGSCSIDSQVTDDDSKFVEFLSIHILAPVLLVFIPQYFSSPVFITVSIWLTSWTTALQYIYWNQQ